jgi:hypothetical protein
MGDDQHRFGEMLDITKFKRVEPEYIERAKQELAEDEKLLLEHEKNVEGLKWLKQELYKKDKPA